MTMKRPAAATETLAPARKRPAAAVATLECTADPVMAPFRSTGRVAPRPSGIPFGGGVDLLAAERKGREEVERRLRVEQERRICAEAQVAAVEAVLAERASHLEKLHGLVAAADDRLASADKCASERLASADKRAFERLVAAQATQIDAERRAASAEAKLAQQEELRRALPAMVRHMSRALLRGGYMYGDGMSSVKIELCESEGRDLPVPATPAAAHMALSPLPPSTLGPGTPVPETRVATPARVGAAGVVGRLRNPIAGGAAALMRVCSGGDTGGRKRGLAE